MDEQPDEIKITRTSNREFHLTIGSETVSIRDCDQINCMPRCFMVINQLFGAAKGAHGELCKMAKEMICGEANK